VACKGGVPLLPAVLVLWDTRVHVSTANGSDIATDVEAAINKHLSYQTTLRVPYVYLDNCHVGF